MAQIVPMKTKDIWGMLGESAAKSGAGALQGWIEGKEKVAEQQRAKSARSELANRYNIPFESLDALDPKQLQNLLTSTIKEAPKTLAKQQEAQSGALQVYEELARANELFSQRLGHEGTLTRLPESSSYVQAKDILKSLKNNPYVRKAGITIPSIETGKKLPEVIEEVQKKLADTYDLFPKQNQQQQNIPPELLQQMQQQQQNIPPELLQQMQQMQQQGSQLPQSLKQPRSVQGELSQGPIGELSQGPINEQQNPLARIASQLGFHGLTSGNPIGVALTRGSELIQKLRGTSEDLPTQEEVDRIAKTLPPFAAENFKKTYEYYKSERALVDKLPTRENIKNVINYAIGSDYLTPNQNDQIEKTINQFADRLGNLRLFGSSMLGAAQETLAGLTGRKGAELLDLGPVAEDIADVGFSMFYGPLFNTVRESVKTKTGKVFDKVATEGAEKFANVVDANDQITDIIQRASRNTSEPSQALVKQLTEAKKLTQFKNMDIAQLRNEVKVLNNWYYDSPKVMNNDTLTKYYHTAKNALNESIVKGLQKNNMPGLARDYTKSIQAYAGLKQTEKAFDNLSRVGKASGFNSTLVNSLTESPVEKIGAIAGGMAGGIPGAFAGVVAANPVNRMINIYKTLKLPYAKEQFLKLGPAAFTNNTVAMKLHLGNLDKFASKH